MDLGPEDCRTIFLDWALGLPEGAGRPEIAALLDHYGPAPPRPPDDRRPARGPGTRPAPRPPRPPPQALIRLPDERLGF